MTHDLLGKYEFNLYLSGRSVAKFELLDKDILLEIYKINEWKY